MDLKNYPEEQRIDISESLFTWLAGHTRVLYVLIGVLSVLIFMLSVYALKPVLTEPEPGGVEGCVTDILGNPLTGTVKVGTRSKPIYANGCFFFKNLTPGAHQIEIVTVTGKTMNQTVEIVSGRAVNLGRITIP